MCVFVSVVMLRYCVLIGSAASRCGCRLCAEIRLSGATWYVFPTIDRWNDSTATSRCASLGSYTCLSDLLVLKGQKTSLIVIISAVLEQFALVLLLLRNQIICDYLPLTQWEWISKHTRSELTHGWWCQNNRSWSLQMGCWTQSHNLVWNRFWVVHRETRHSQSTKLKIIVSEEQLVIEFWTFMSFIASNNYILDFFIGYLSFLLIIWLFKQCLHFNFFAILLAFIYLFLYLYMYLYIRFFCYFILK